MIIVCFVLMMVTTVNKYMPHSYKKKTAHKHKTQQKKSSFKSILTEYQLPTLQLLALKYHLKIDIPNCII